MPQIHVTGHDGQEKTLEGADGQSVMEVIRDNGFDELLALCGGSCACATCHVYVDAAWLEKVGSPVGDEDDLLESSDYREPRSRLSCQIPVTDAIDGLRVTIAPMD